MLIIMIIDKISQKAPLKITEAKLSAANVFCRIESRVGISFTINYARFAGKKQELLLKLGFEVREFKI